MVRVVATLYLHVTSTAKTDGAFLLLGRWFYLYNFFHRFTEINISVGKAALEREPVERRSRMFIADF